MATTNKDFTRVVEMKFLSQRLTDKLGLIETAPVLTIGMKRDGDEKVMILLPKF